MKNEQGTGNREVSRRGLLFGGLAAIGAVGLSACGKKAVETPAPATKEPDPSVAPTTQTETQTPTPTPEATKNPNVLSFETAWKEHLAITKDDVKEWLDSGDLESVANYMALEALNASENTWTGWDENYSVNPIHSETVIWRNADTMSAQQLACGIMIGSGMASLATDSGRISGGSTPNSKPRISTILEAQYGLWSRDTSSPYGKSVKDSTEQNLLSYSTIKSIDYSYTKEADKVGSGTVTMANEKYSYIDVAIPNVLNNGIPSTAVVRAIRIPVTKGWAFDSGRSKWEEAGGSRGLGSMSVDANGKPLTPDGKPVEWLLPIKTVSLKLKNESR